MTTPTTVNVRLQLRADTAANWTAANPTLLANEVGLETDTKKLKVGNGSTAWNSLAYFPSIVSGGTVLGNLEIGSTGTLTFEGSTADGFETTLAVTNPTADRTITLPDQSGTVVVTGNASIVNADIAANAEIAVSKLANGTANQVIVTDGTNVSWSDDLTIAGNLTVNGTTTTISTQNLLVEDKNIIIGDVATPTDTTADGGGITLKGATDKTINWVDATDAWTSSERFSVPLGTNALPSLTFTGDADTGIYSPGANQVAISTSSSERIRIGANGEIGLGGANYGTNGQVLTSAGSGAAPTWQTLSVSPNSITQGNTNATVTDTGSDGRFVVTTEGSERLRITSAGLVGIGTSSPRRTLDITGGLVVSENSGGIYNGYLLYSNSANANARNYGVFSNFLAFGDFGVVQSNALGGDPTSVGTTRLYINSTGNVGIGTTSPSELLHVTGGNILSTNGFVRTAGSSVNAVTTRGFRQTIDGTELLAIYHDNNGAVFNVNTSERARIDSSGRLLVGTSSALAAQGVTSSLQLHGATAGQGSGAQSISYWQNNTTSSALLLNKSRGATPGSYTIVQNGDGLGTIAFGGADGTAIVRAAVIDCQVDGTPAYAATALVNGQTYRIVTVGTTDFTLIGASANTVGTVFTATGPGTGTGTAILNAGNMPGRLVFSTTADGASSPTERMRITSAGALLYAQQATATPGETNTTTGIGFTSDGTISASRASGKALNLNRNNDGAAAVIYRSGTEVGSISVTTTATAYNTSSDYRLKENVTAVTDGIARLQQLKPSRFNFIADPDKTVDGFLAHEVQTIVPEAITGEKDAVDSDGNPVYQGIDHSKLVPLLTAALQEAVAKIETLQGMVAVNNITIDEQQHQISALAARISALESA